MTVVPAILRLILLSAVLLFADRVHADQLVLKNGDRLTGTIVAQDEQAVSIETPYAGTIHVQRSNVASVVYGQAQADAAVAVAAQAKPAPKAAHKGYVNVSAAYARGNTSSDHIYAEAGYTARSADRRYTLGAKLTRAAEGGVTTASSVLGEGNYDWFLDGKDFRYVRGSAERDRFKDIEMRNTIGAGYGLQLLDSERSMLAVRAGPDLVMVNRIASENETYPAFGWGVKFSHWLVAERVELFHDQDGFWNLEDIGQVIVRTRTGLRVPLTDQVNMSAQLNLDWEREPAPMRDAIDSTWLLGVGYKW